jgi:hypothetical protein
MVILSDNFVATESESAHVPKYVALFRHLCFLFSNKIPHFWADTGDKKGNLEKIPLGTEVRVLT